MRRAITPIVIAVLLAAGCSPAASHGVVEGAFTLPGGPAADLQRGGLNFAKTNEGVHGNGAGHTVEVDAAGQYTVTLPSGSYSVIGGLSGQPGGPAAEKCGATLTVVVKANTTTRADYLCYVVPATTSKP